MLISSSPGFNHFYPVDPIADNFQGYPSDLPGAPSNLGAISTGPTAHIQLSWTDNSNNETGFSIERKAGGAGTFSEIVTLSSNVITYDDYTVIDGITYTYRVRAYNSFGYSDYSNEKSASL